MFTETSSFERGWSKVILHSTMRKEAVNPEQTCPREEAMKGGPFPHSLSRCALCAFILYMYISWYIYVYSIHISIPTMTSIFDGQPPKTRPFPIKTLVHLAVVARPLNTVHPKIAAYCSKQYIVYWIFQICWISDFNYPVFLRILGFFSCSFSRKLHHPQGSLSVLMTSNFKKPNQLFFCFQTHLTLPIHMSFPQHLLVSVDSFESPRASPHEVRRQGAATKTRRNKGSVARNHEHRRGNTTRQRGSWKKRC